MTVLSNRPATRPGRLGPSSGMRAPGLDWLLLGAATVAAISLHVLAYRTGLLVFYLTLAADDPFFAGNAAVHLALNDAGIRHRFTVAEGKHDWIFWRQALPEALRHLGAVMTRQYGE